MNKLPLSGILSPCQEKEATRKHGFTLVELIVVITILAILGTIAFISLQGYSKDARDSVRISDISKIKTSLELFQLDAGKYPDTTDATIITYSGAIAWTQGTFGESTFNNVTKLDKIPLDPVTDRQYVYSITNTKQEYQLAGIMEGDEVTISSHLPLGEGLGVRANAAQKTAMVKISGNYNGKLLKVSTGGTDYVLAIPSIITSSGFTVETIVENNLLAYNGYKNLPSQYAGSSYDVLGDDEINLVNSADLVVYSGDIKTLSSTEPAGIDARKNLIIKLKSAYAGTAITGIGEIAQIINTQTTNTGAVEALSTTIVSNNLGGSVTVTSGGGTDISTNSCATQPSYTHATFTVGTPTRVNQEYVKDATNCGYTCTDLYTGTNCEIAPSQYASCGSEIEIKTATTTYLNCSSPDIIVCSGNGTGYTIAACNAGTTLAGTGASSYGNYYQFGKADTSWLNGNVSWNYDWKDLGGTNGGSANFWGISDVDKTTALFSNQNLENQIKMQGPCSDGYHIPTFKEMDSLVKLKWDLLNANLGTNLGNDLKLPMAGYRKRIDGVFVNYGFGQYWTSSPSGNKAYVIYFEPSFISSGDDWRGLGCNVRCFKD